VWLSGTGFPPVQAKRWLDGALEVFLCFGFEQKYYPERILELFEFLRMCIFVLYFTYTNRNSYVYRLQFLPNVYQYMVAMLKS
jgi:hypothetical protein